MNAEIAIVIPAYKASFLRRTLQSLVDQTDKRFHVYVGDDDSPHHLFDIMMEFDETLPFSYRRFEENLGAKDLVGQWERCIAMTENEPYIWLFSDDDVLEPDCVEKFLALPKELRDNSLIHFDVEVIDDNDVVVDRPAAYPERLGAEEYLHKKLRGELISYVVEFIFPRSLYERTGGFERFDLAWGSDFMTWLKMGTEAKKGIVSVKGPKVRWRRSAENISPRMDRPTMIRKIKSLIGNSVFVKKLIKSHRDSFPESGNLFRWTRFPLGEISRKRRALGILASLRLTVAYFLAHLKS